MRWSSSGLAKDIDQLHNLRAVFTVRIILGFTFDTIYSGLSWRDGEMLLGHDADQIEIFEHHGSLATEIQLHKLLI